MAGLKPTRRRWGVALAVCAVLLAGTGATAPSAVATLARPATVAVRLTEGAAGFGGEPAPGSPGPVLELRLGRPARGVAAAELLVRVFLNRPAADAATPKADPGYVGSFALFDGYAAGDAGDEELLFLLPLSDTMAKLARAGATDPLAAEPTATVVLVPIDTGANAAGATITVEGATIDVR